jgi:hypothetical protein
MPTLQAQPIDVQWIVQLASGTFYTGYPAALAAAVTLSAANSNAPVQIAQVELEATSGTSPTIQLPGNGSPLYIVQLATATTYYPQATAIAQAYSTSTSNSNAGVYVARVLQQVTAP